MILKHLAYETLIRLWPISKGQTRWLNIVSQALDIQPYGYFKYKAVGRYRLRLDPGDANDRLFYFDMFGSGYTLVLSRLLRLDDCVIDVGANVGHFSAIAAQHVGLKGRVNAIEANPGLAERLRQCVAEVPEGPIRIRHAAAWHSSGSIAFHVAADVSGWSSLIQNPTFEAAYTVQVPAITLDEFVVQENIKEVRFLKLDIEGAETDALLGGTKLLNSDTLDCILVEADPHRLKAFGHSGKELNELLEHNGYRAVCVVQNKKVSRITEATRTPGAIVGDYLYARDPLYRYAVSEIFR